MRYAQGRESTLGGVTLPSRESELQPLVGLLVPADPCPPDLTRAFAQAAQSVLDLRPQTVIAISAAWRTRGFVVDSGALRRSLELPTDRELAQRIVDEANDAGLPSAQDTFQPDDATLPALMRLLPQQTALVMLGVPLASPSLLQEFGQAATRAARELDRRVLTLAVGALTHHHSAAPDDPAIGTFTTLVLEHLRRGEGDRLFEIDGALWVAARPEADLGHLAVLLGATGPDAQGETLAVEATGGMRSAVVQLRAQPAGPWTLDMPWDDTQRAGGI